MPFRIFISLVGTGVTTGLLALSVPSPAQASADWVTRAFTPDRQSWVFTAEYFAPTLYNRPIDFMTLEAARAWKLPSGFEVHLRGGIAHSAGSRSDDPDDGEGRDSSTTGVTSSFALRYELPLTSAARIFAQGSMGFYWARQQPFPSGGSAINGLLRGGSGISYDLSDRYALELSWQAAHISNGGKPPHNPTWEGEGGSIALRYRF